jgi:hypothetical protein
MQHERDRVISISLSEAEWQELVARHPQPVNWIREQIRTDLGVSGSAPERASQPGGKTRTRLD